MRFGKILFLSAAMLANQCKKSDSDSTPAATPTGSLRISLVASGEPATTGLVKSEISASSFQNGNIASGSPVEMSVSFAKMTLVNSKTNESLPIFVEPDGKEVKIVGSSVDLSNLFTKIECLKSDGTVFEVPEGKTCKCGVDAAGVLIDQVSVTDVNGATTLGCPEHKEGETPPFGVLEVDQEGEFDKLTVEFINKGTAAGCVEGNFKAYGAKTYCTKTGLDLDSATTLTRSLYPSADPTTSTIYWSKSGKDGNAQFNASYPMDKTIAITADGETPAITMVIDQGRILRFFDGETSQGPNPGAGTPGDKAYFFSTIFENSTYIFVGQAGSIRGYRYSLAATHGVDLGTAVPAEGSRTCVSDCKNVNGWLTIIEDTKGAPLAISLMPDDDNAFTVMKGGNYDSSNPGAILQSQLQVNGNNWTLNYNQLNSSAVGLSGSIVDLDSTKDVGTTQTLEFDAKQTDTGLHTFQTWGDVSLERKL